MNYITTALLAEASFLIEQYQLTKTIDTHFNIYENEKIKLIISGIGKVDAAAATTYLLQKYQAKREDYVYNIGTCTSTKETEPIGELFSIKKIIDFSTDKVYHLKNLGEALTCVDKALTSSIPIKTPLADMESVGFYVAAKRFIPLEHIMILKVISDKTDETIPRPEDIKALFIPHTKTIGALLI